MESRKANVLNQLDTAKFSRAHVRAILVAGSGFLTDSYDNFVIGLAVPMIAVVYFNSPTYKLPMFVQDGMVKAASSIGNLIGQFSFGIMGDILGRKKMYGIELVILIVGAIGSALSASPKAGVDIIAILGFWRLILGIGVGGDYPVSAIIAAEFAASKYRGTMMATVFAMQGFGNLLGSVVGICTVAAFKNMIIADPNNLDYCWRILLGFGAVPALLAVYFRFTIPETPRFSMDVLEDVERSALAAKNFVGADVTVDQADTAHVHVDVMQSAKKYGKEFKRYFSKWKNARTLIATSAIWFLFDIGFFGTNLNNTAVLGYIGYGDSKNAADYPYQGIWARVTGNAIINLCGLPGYWVSVGLIDVWGRKPIQFMGFGILTVLFAILAGAYHVLTAQSPVAFVAIYALAQFFYNFGPNPIHFIVPAECFPTQVRSTAHGISAGIGKAGAVVAALGFQWVASNAPGGLQACMWIFTASNLGGFLLTFLLPETKGKTLEELSREFEIEANDEYHSAQTVSDEDSDAVATKKGTPPPESA